MTGFIIQQITYLNIIPVIFIAQILYSITVFDWMQVIGKIKNRYDEIVYAVVILANGVAATVFFTCSGSDTVVERPNLLIVSTPLIVCIEYMFLSSRPFKVYLFHLTSFMMHLTCVFGVVTAFVTECAFYAGLEPDSHDVIVAILILTEIAVAISGEIFYFIARKNGEYLGELVMRKHSFLLTMSAMGGIILTVLAQLDYRTYFISDTANPLRRQMLIATSGRYIVVLVASMIMLNALTRLGQKEHDVSVLEKDAVTGILNRASFRKKVKRCLELQQDKGEHWGAFFILDLDNFKAVNDNFGHPEGDQLLKRTADMLASLFREDDVVARIGGDEFMIFVNSDIDRDTALEKGESINRNLSYVYHTENKDTLTVTASVGIALNCAGSSSYEDLYDMADRAMYQAKQNGKAGTVILPDFMLE